MWFVGNTLPESPTWGLGLPTQARAWTRLASGGHRLFARGVAVYLDYRVPLLPKVLCPSDFTFRFSPGLTSSCAPRNTHGGIRFLGCFWFLMLRHFRSQVPFG